MIPVFRYRKFHRWLAIIIGLQLLMWTSSGIYFAWTDLDEIHGDFTRAEPSPIQVDEEWVSPGVVLGQLPAEHAAVSVEDLDLLDIGSRTVYRIVYVDAAGNEAVVLADAATGALRPPLSEAEAIELARLSFAPQASVSEIVLLEEGDVGPHHEYRGRPLPAYRVTFDHPSRTHVFVATEYGEVMAHRNVKWRVFDFLWMLHTMDYATRDDFNHPLLRGISIAALVVALSGYLLWWKTRKRRRRTV